MTTQQNITHWIDKNIENTKCFIQDDKKDAYFRGKVEGLEFAKQIVEIWLRGEK